MLLPHPESDLSLNLLVLGTEVLTALGKRKVFVFAESLLDEFLERDSRRSSDMFFNVLCVLYSMGLIEYRDYRIRIKQQLASQMGLFNAEGV